VTFARDHHRTGLASLLARFFGGAHRHPDLETIEARILDAVAMKVDLPPIGRFKEAVPSSENSFSTRARAAASWIFTAPR